MYDSTEDTLKHINRVRQLLQIAINELERRALVHDQSKLESPEKEGFDRVGDSAHLKAFGTPEYQEGLDMLGEALTHHYEVNTHHPQHYPNGINGMNLFDMIEMFFDWKAASERYKDSTIQQSVLVNTERFDLSDQLVNLMNNTVEYLEW